ncbi:transglutaminase-like domain-containing protein [Nocardiopsis sp. NPDC058631]|uniref:transglutaminase-like domain-containing protein n=1 Tax=Nocardiopsis sp. NPDC058631 TaxID=3346566 RepID=UPI003658AF77
MATLTPPRPPETAPAPGRGPGALLRALLAAAGLVMAAAAGGVALAPGYAEPGPVYAVLPLCALLSVAVTLAARARLAPLAGILVGLPLPLAGVVVCAVRLPGQGTGVLEGTVEALLHSGARILTSAAPTPLSVDTLTLPLLATWITGVASVLLWQGNRPALAVLPGLLALVGAVVLNGPVAPPGFPSIGLVAVAAILLMAASSDDRSAARGRTGPEDLRIEVDAPEAHPPGRLGRVLTTVLAAALAATATVFGGPVLLASWEVDPGDPREAVRPPLAPEAALNPLGYLSAWAAEPDEPLLTVRSEEPVDLRWVALADFTGTTWLPEGGYRAAGEVLPDPVPPPPHATGVRAEISVGDDLPGGWAPVVGVPRRVGLQPLGYDAVSGTVVSADGGIAGARYEVTGDVADWRAAELAEASVPADTVFDRYRELPPGAPTVLNDVAAAVAGQGSPYERAVLLSEYLRESHYFSAETPGGHGYANVAGMLAPPGQEGGGGTSEQFASAFAMLARAAGLPSRVVVGFGSGTDGGDGVRTVLTGDALAWGEVYFNGVGWVPFSVTPGEEGEDEAEESSSGAAEAEAPEESDDANSLEDDADPGTPPEGDREAAPLWPFLSAGGALLAAVCAVPALRLARSRWRLRPGSPDRRVLGAWRELRDHLRQCASAPQPGHTVGDTVALVQDLLPEEGREWARVDLRRLGGAVNRVGFAPGSGLSETEAAHITDGVRRQSRALRRTLGRGRRLAWWFDPRPLFWRAP